MSVHRATVDWRLEGDDFLARRYSRAHTISFDGGLTLPGSPALSVVPLPYGRAGAMDPESALTAALSACHMLWFLDFAAQGGFVVTAYRDEAEGTLGKNQGSKGQSGKMQVTRVVLRPKVSFAEGRSPSPTELDDLHRRSHEACFIANSVTTNVVIESQGADPAR